ncbi:MAG TPA: DnaJ domain-containing protein [Polyangiales bacterium]|nr:DnaJ domain-containing protein [Polyangiales bacterium]
MGALVFACEDWATLSELDQRVPELIAGVDVRSLPLSALDGFVFSRIDGRTRVGEIVAMTGLPAEQVVGILERLVELGAVRMPGPSSASQSGVRGFPRAQVASGLFHAQSEPPSSGPAPRPTSISVTGQVPVRPPSVTRQPPVPPPSGTGHPAVSSSGRPPTGAPPSSSSAPPRRRPSMMGSGAPRRVFAESSISGPPPDMRSFPPRARVSTPSRPRTPVPPDARAQPRTPPPPGVSTPPPRASIPVTLPPLSLPPSMSGPPLFPSTPPPSGKPVFESEANTATRPQLPVSSLEPPRPSAPVSLYDERELDEEVDLPRERRKQVLDLFYRLSDIDYYTLLGVPQSADKKEIRSAYFALSKAFHPDSMFRKELGSFKAKMVAVFQAATEGYEALGKKKTRDEYDAYLRSTRAVQQAERALATQEVAQADTNVEVPRPPPLPTTDYDLPPPTPMPSSAPASPREVSPEAQRIARELIQKRLRALPQRPAPVSVTPAPNVPPPPVSMDRQQLARELGRTLMDVGKLTGSNDKLQRALNGSKAAFERGDIAGSVQHMARAFSLAPERADLHNEYERLQQMLAQQMASNYVEQAKFEMKQSKFAAAAASWQKVCEGKPQDAEAHRHAAFCMLKAGGDQRSAQRYAQQAVYLAPNDIDARILLAQTYLTVGLKLNAKRELDAAAKLDPANEVVKNLLSDLAK